MTTLPTREAMTGNPPVSIFAKPDYFDVIHARFKRRLHAKYLAFLRKNCGGRVRYETDKPIPGWPYRLVLNQPNDHAFRYLDQRFGDDVLINRLESSVDLITKDKRSAEVLKLYSERYLVQKNRRARQLGKPYTTTSYWRGQRWVTLQPVVYLPSDGSKVVKGAPCVRAEVRVCGARAVRGVGVYRFADLIDYDHHDLWRRTIRFAALDPAGLGRAKRYAEGDKRRRLPDPDLDLQSGTAMALAARQFDDDGKPRRADLTIQEIIDKYRDGLDLRLALIPLDHDWLLPEPKP